MQSESFEQRTELPPLNDGMGMVDAFNDLVDKRCEDWVQSNPHNLPFKLDFKLGWYKAELAFYMSIMEPEAAAIQLNRYQQL